MNIKGNIASEFDEFSKNYTSDMQKCVPHYNYLLSCFSTGYAHNFNAQSILDLGCGNGNVTEQLLNLFPKANYTLLDASKEMLRMCQGRFQDQQINIVESYFNEYQFTAKHFDIVAGGFSLHHCNNLEKQELFNKIYISLKDKGVFASSDLMINKRDSAHPQLIEQWKNLVNKNFPNGEKWAWIMEHYDEYDKPDSLENQIQWLRNVGFRDIEISVKDQYWVHFKSFK